MELLFPKTHPNRHNLQPFAVEAGHLSNLPNLPGPFSPEATHVARSFPRFIHCILVPNELDRPFFEGNEGNACYFPPLLQLFFLAREKTHT